MTPPGHQLCLNCHSTPQTPPEMFPWEDMGTPEPQDCPGFSDWASQTPQLRTLPQRESIQEPWWVRSRYETARSRSLPARIRVNEASLQILLMPSERVPRSIPLISEDTVPWVHDLLATLEIDSDTTLGLFLSIQDDQWQVRDQSFLETENVTLDGTGYWNISNPQIRVDESGMIHLETQLPPEAWWRDRHADLILNLPWRPQILGEGFDTALQWAIGLEDQESVDFREMPFPLNMQGWEALPESLGFEWLLEILNLLWGARPEGPETPVEERFAQIREGLSFLRPGSRLSTGEIQLGDLFIPYGLDLGPSSGLLNIELNESGGLDMEIPALDLNLEAMGYSLNPSDGTVGRRLEGGHIQWIPGQSLSAQLDPQAQTLSFNAPLRVDLEFSDQAWGRFRLRGDLTVQSEIFISSDGVQVIPGSTYIHLSQGDLDWLEGPEGEVPSGPLPAFLSWLGHIPEGEWGPGTGEIHNLELELGDSEEMRGVLSGLQEWIDPEGPVPWEFQISGNLGFRDLMASGQVQMPRHENGAIDLSPSVLLNALLGEVRIDLPGALENSHLRVEHANGEAGRQIQVALSAAHLSLSQFIEGGLELRDVGLDLAVEVSPGEDGQTQYRFPTLNVQAHGDGSQESWVHGALRLIQQPGHELIISTEPATASVEIQDGHLAFLGHGIHLPSGLRRFLDPQIASVGVDGQLQAQYHFDMPAAWEAWGPIEMIGALMSLTPEQGREISGRGLIRLRGDRRGDIYWFDRRGRRVGPALIRDTRWCWRNINQINVDRGYALGSFYMDILANPQALMHFSHLPEMESTQSFYSQDGRELRPYEVQIAMPYDNQPASGRGFQNRIVDYINGLHRRSGTANSRRFIPVRRCR